MNRLISHVASSRDVLSSIACFAPSAFASQLPSDIAAWQTVACSGSATALFGIVRIVGLVLAFALGGCAALPGDVSRAASYARADVAQTQLARIAAASTPEDKRGLSGFRLLPDGEEAFQARIALIRRAEKTLDVQYYLIASDRTGLQFLRELRDAAARGVRVRVLIDDLYAAGQDADFAGLAVQSNAEVRMFNPLDVRRGTFAERLALSMHELSRVNHRMHNKLFVADDTYAIVGGRNIADEYFDRSSKANFIDTDVLASGAVVHELSGVFDRFWNSEQAFPLQSLAPVDLESVRGALARTVANAADAAAAASGAVPFGVVQELAAGFVRSDFSTARVVADAPSKAGDAIASEGPPALATQALFRQAETDILVSSPYVIPGRSGMAAFSAARRANVPVRIFTNSLGSTDEPMVYAGYAKYRPALEALGVSLYELAAAHREGGATPAGSASRLHAKLAVVDGRWSTIGSMNLDRRSAVCNTEMVLIVDNPNLATQVSAFITGHLSGANRVSAQPAASSEEVAINWAVRLSAELVGEERL